MDVANDAKQKVCCEEVWVMVYHWAKKGDSWKMGLTSLKELVYRMVVDFEFVVCLFVVVIGHNSPFHLKLYVWFHL